MSETNAKVAELTETGKTKFYHRSGTHNDRLWALAPAVYGSRHETPYHQVPCNPPRKLYKPAAIVRPATSSVNQPPDRPRNPASCAEQNGIPKLGKKTVYADISVRTTLGASPS